MSAQAIKARPGMCLLLEDPINTVLTRVAADEKDRVPVELDKGSKLTIATLSPSLTPIAHAMSDWGTMQVVQKTPCGCYYLLGCEDPIKLRTCELEARTIFFVQ